MLQKFSISVWLERARRDTEDYINIILADFDSLHQRANQVASHVPVGRGQAISDPISELF